MIMVLVWLSSAAFLAQVLALHAGVQAVRLARRVRYRWLAVLLIAVVCAWVEGLEGPNNGDDPIALVPRLVKWGWFAGVLVALRHPVRWAAWPLLLVGQLATVSFILGPAELAAAQGSAAQLAWALDKATLLEGLVREAFDGLWGGALAFPSEPVLGYLGALAPYFLPLALGLFAAFTLAILRAATGTGLRAASPVAPAGHHTAGHLAHESLDTLPPLRLRPLGPAVALALLVPWLPLDGLGALGAGLVVLARLLWLFHLVATLHTCWGEAVSTAPAPLGSAWTRRLGRDGTALLALALCVLPDVVGPVLGGLGVVLAQGGRPADAPSAPLTGLVGWPALLTAAVVFAVLRSVELEPNNPQAAREHATATWPAGTARSAESAEAACRTQRARLASLVSWRASRGAPGASVASWQWVRIPSAGGTVVGLVQAVGEAGSPRAATAPGEPPRRDAEPNNNVGVFVLAGAYHAAIGAPAAAVRCSRETQ